MVWIWWFFWSVKMGVEGKSTTAKMADIISVVQFLVVDSLKIISHIQNKCYLLFLLDIEKSFMTSELFACKVMGVLVAFSFRLCFGCSSSLLCLSHHLHFPPPVFPFPLECSMCSSHFQSFLFHKEKSIPILFSVKLWKIWKRKSCRWIRLLPSPQLSPSLPYSSTQEPSQQSASPGASPLSKSESLESPGSSKPGVASLRTAAAFKPVGSTSAIKSPNWQRPSQAGIQTKKNLTLGFSWMKMCSSMYDRLC